MMTACKKQDEYLDIKRNKTDVTPKTLEDFQAVLDNNQVMNGYSSIIGLIGTDNLYAPDTYLDAADQTVRNAYLWNKDIYQGTTAAEWQYPYQVVEYANIVLDGLNALSADEQSQAVSNIKGSALFFRAYAFYELAQLYCKTYTPESAATDLGIPLRLTSDVNVRVGRSTLQATYDQILNDLKSSVVLLPKVPLYKTRPSSTAAQALLAKVYFSKGDYDQALNYVNNALLDNSSLIDFNTLTLTTANPFPTLAKGNPEVIFHAWGLGYTLTTLSGRGRISPDLYQSYEAGDLRKAAFFTADGTTGYYRFKGSYSANAYYFCGIAVNELLLIKAECLARREDITGALDNLNLLLRNRYTKTAYLPVSLANKGAILNRIILERRKEMPFTAQLRWEDLKRLNRQTETQSTLRRLYRNNEYILLPNDPRYVYPLPDDELQLNNLPQNSR
ncbi:RagB/SusD family nutrient uptake outer membrane protein [Mucilaginibacter sp. PAMB04274]|uniref:RagB/SusD family nutrient uptake outer membrane protein n=1 Tax=Mucilaginibacter sp. PAMB04274 TaxID=3138568 RepID=UPI0031F6AB7F